jgi:hypothetical protein
LPTRSATPLDRRRRAKVEINGYFTSRSLNKTIEHQATQTRLTLDAQLGQAHWSDARALRDAKRERIYAAYSALLDQSQALFTWVAVQEGFVQEFMPATASLPLDGFSQELRLRAASLMAESRKQLSALALEGDTGKVFNAASGVMHAYSRYLNMYLENHQQPGTFSPDQLRAEYSQLLVQGVLVQKLAREHLAEFEQPIPARPQRYA